MHPILSDYFHRYSPSDAPFMHQQLSDWSKSRPLANLRLVHHVPVVANTVLKIACLVAAGAEVVVTNPTSFNDVEEQLDQTIIRNWCQYHRFSHEQIKTWFVAHNG